MQGSNTTLVIIGALVIGLTAGYFGGVSFAGAGSTQEVAERLREAGYAPPSNQEQIVLIGTVESVENGSVRLRLSQPSLEKTIRGEEDIRTIDISNARLMREVPLSEAEVEAEQERFNNAFEQALAAGGDIATIDVEPPQFVREEPITQDAIEVGVRMYAETDEPADDNASLTATRVVIEGDVLSDESEASVNE